MKKLIATLLVVLFLCGAIISQESSKKDEKEQFIFVLKLTPRLLNEKNWTERDRVLVGRHFRRLKQLVKEGKVILAGKTLDDTDPSQFGVVILEVNSEQEARKILEEDDAVKEKIMIAQLFPFRVALIR